MKTARSSRTEQKDSPNNLPPGWRLRKIGELGEIAAGGTPSRGNPGYFAGQIPWVKTLDLNNDLVRSTEEQITHEALRAIRGELLPVGTVMVAMYGGGGTIGKSGLLGIRAATNQAVCSILPNPEEFDSSFLHYALIHIRPKWMRYSSGNRKDPNISKGVVAAMQIAMPEPPEQRRIAARLQEQFTDVAKARAAVQAQAETLNTLVHAVLRESLKNGSARPARFADALHEVTAGIGDDWSKYPVLGATREGLAPAKEPVGKNPGRYKPVRPGTVFYNPMRILLGSIAMLDEGDAPGITSPDYVVMTAVEGRLSARWFYHWFRSRYGAEFIKSMTRGAVRERLLFKRLAPATILIPDWQRQQAADSQLAAIKLMKVRLDEKQAALDHLPAALLRGAFAGRI